MNKALSAPAIAFLFLLPVSIATAQEPMTVGDLKAKGATVLNAEEVKTLLVGATQRYENSQFATTMKVSPDGSLSGTSARRLGSSGGGGGSGFTGEWKVTDDGQFCAETKVFGAYGGGAKYCRNILKADDKYYYAQGNPKNDKRTAVEMSISK